MCGHEDPPFHASPASRKGPISSKRVSSQDPLLRKFGNFSLCSINFHPNFSSQAPKLGSFQLTSPLIWKFSAHKPTNLEIFSSQAPNLEIFRSQVPPPFRRKCQFASPTLRKSGPHTPTWKKVECPPGHHSESSHNQHDYKCFRSYRMTLHGRQYTYPPYPLQSRHIYEPSIRGGGTYILRHTRMFRKNGSVFCFCFCFVLFCFSI